MVNSIGSRRRVLALLPNFPIVSQTYMLNELAAIPRSEFDVHVCSLRPPKNPCEEAPKYIRLDSSTDLLDLVRRKQPDVLHTHFLKFAPLVAELAERSGIPFTVRAHSFDTLSQPVMPRLVSALLPVVRAINSPLCLGVLTFPFTLDRLTGLGIRKDRLVSCPPVIDFFRFFNRQRNGDGVLNLGACMPKKRLNDFIWLAQHVKSRCNLYPIGYDTSRFIEQNDSVGGPVNVKNPVQPSQMPMVYKSNNWLVYTASWEDRTVGWPMAVAEAQAAGLGVCIAKIRDDLADYVGPAGFLYHDIAEVPPLLRLGYPERMREAGFEHARQWHIGDHIDKLLNLWRSTPLLGKRVRPSFLWYRRFAWPLLRRLPSFEGAS
jgi:hypothetical protein